MSKWLLGVDLASGNNIEWQLKSHNLTLTIDFAPNFHIGIIQLLAEDLEMELSPVKLTLNLMWDLPWS